MQEETALAVAADGGVDRLTHHVSSLALSPSDVVVLVGLEGASSRYNLRAARVIEQQASERHTPSVRVQLIHGEQKERLWVRRHEVVRASHAADRAALLTRIVLQRQLELRVCRAYLMQRLHGEEGLLLHIASFFPVRETMALTTGFANGNIVPSWICATLHDGPRLGWHQLGGHEWSGDGLPVDGEHPVSDGIVRIDCAVVRIRVGQFLVAGGCADHPARATAYFDSAFLYDSLTHVVTPLPPMPHERHGCSGAYLNGKVYVIGGDYVLGIHPDSKRKLCCVFDLESRIWSNLDVDESIITSTGNGQVAFSPLGAIDGRLVLLHDGWLLAFNPLMPEVGWQRCVQHGGDEDHQGILGRFACAGVTWGRHFVVSTGRGGSPTCQVLAFSFTHPPSITTKCKDGAVTTPHPGWTRGQWVSLGATGSGGRVGCALAVVHNRLYVTGGVDEPRTSSNGNCTFDGSVVRWTGTLADLDADEPDIEELRSNVEETSRLPWRVVEGLELPTPMHAHHAITIPWLPVEVANPPSDISADAS